MSFSRKSPDEGRDSVSKALFSIVLFSLLVVPSARAQPPSGEGAAGVGKEARARPDADPGKLLPQKQPPSKKAASGAEKNRERWANLPPEKRKRIERIYQQLRQLPAEERALLLDRLRAMDSSERRSFIRKAEAELEKDPIERQSRLIQRETVRRSLEKLSPDEREKLKALSPKERQEYLKRKEAARREKIVSGLPEPLRERVRAMSPKEQAEFLRARRGEQILKETFRDAEELQRIRGLPQKRIVELVRSAARREKGAPKPDAQKPDFVSEETWKRWLELKPFERASALSALKASRDQSPAEPPLKRSNR